MASSIAGPSTLAMSPTAEGSTSSSAARSSLSPSVLSPSLKLLDQAELIKQGAEAKVYVLSHLFPTPSIYIPSLAPVHPLPTQPSQLGGPFSSTGGVVVKNASDSESESASQPGPSTILKYRFPKTYRHPTLDASLTRLRLASEARALARCLRHGVRVPRVVFVDEKSGVLGLERIEGWSVREVLGGGAEGEVEDEVEEEEEREVAADGVEKEEEEELGAGEGEEEREEIVVKLGNVNMGQEDGGLGGAASGNSRVNNDGPGNRSHPSGSGDRSQGLDDDAPEHEGMTALKRLGVTQAHLMSSIGAALAKLHHTTLIHGDLTTSNMMIRLTPNATSGTAYEIVIIDFGLSSTAQYPEHYAVDLYVLERAFASTHPASEGLYAGVLEAYAKGLGDKKWKPIESKLKEVRRRGRKRDMTG